VTTDGLHSFATDVTDDHAPVVRADLEDIVEVTSNFGAIAGWAIDGCELETGDMWMGRREEALLQGLGQLPGVNFGFLGALFGA
jgi:hypothetical protein